ncbi:HEAT repeat domain-containing protein [Microbacterium sp. NPDC087665]|uniref:HEAT repeat domain-containing protein n=1 Tax=Microbacterium sp. NPDC087665 TaxID=3364194 RepID=UPI003825C154
MSAKQVWVTALQGLDRAEIPAYLKEQSGLPGPRANLTLVDAVVSLADPDLAPLLLDDGDEYTAMCAAALIGRRADDPFAEEQARGLAADSRWRVREGVAIGLQHLGDRDVASLIPIARQWAEDADPLVQRAAVAALCEPRLLHTDAAKAAALEVCRIATERLAALPDSQRKGGSARTLRQALGYCWSIAVAANPEHGLPAFRALDTAHADIAWIVAENRRKKRLSVLLP